MTASDRPIAAPDKHVSTKTQSLYKVVHFATQPPQFDITLISHPEDNPEIARSPLTNPIAGASVAVQHLPETQHA